VLVGPEWSITNSAAFKWPVIHIAMLGTVAIGAAFDAEKAYCKSHWGSGQ
jgi:hypothetical protein